MRKLVEDYTSGAKFFAQQEAMRDLRNGQGRPVVTHVMATDTCAKSCAFCSVHHREGKTLQLAEITGYLDILLKYNLRAVILSGGGNPILYRCPQTGANFNDLVDAIYSRGLQIGLISDGMRMKDYGGRKSWITVKPETLDKLTWVRVSMAGLDHDENCVDVPDIDTSRTTLGFSYVLHDIHYEPADHYHGKVSTEADIITLDRSRVRPTRWAVDRVPKLIEQIGHYVVTHRPKYVRLLPNCLEPAQISDRCGILQYMADTINDRIDDSPCFVQYKPPAAPNVCLLGYIHPVLNSDGFVLPCDSCCLNESSDHKLGEAWRICHWKDIGRIYEEPVRSLIKDPKALCPGCVFTNSNLLLEKVWRGTVEPTPPTETITHPNFV